MCALREYIKDELRPIDDPGLNRLLQVALLGGRKLSVNDYQICLSVEDSDAQLFCFPFANIVCGIGLTAVLVVFAHHFRPSGYSKRAQLCGGIRLGILIGFDANHQGALQVVYGVGGLSWHGGSVARPRNIVNNELALANRPLAKCMGEKPNYLQCRAKPESFQCPDPT